MAVLSLLFSVSGIWFGPAAVAGIVLGFKARTRIVRAEGATGDRRLALAGIIVGFGALTFFATVVLLVVLPHSANDKALAQRELIPASAYPRGFVGQGPGTDATQASYFASWGPQIVICLGLPRTNVDSHPVEAAGQEHDRGNVWVNDTVDVFPTVAAARADEIASASPNALNCAFRSWGPSLDQEIGPQLGAGEHDNPPIALGASTVGQGISLEMWSITYTYKGKAGISFNDWVTVLRGRSESNLWISNLGSPVGADLMEQLVRAAGANLTNE